jgi:hypothetical protein
LNGVRGITLKIIEFVSDGLVGCQERRERKRKRKPDPTGSARVSVAGVRDRS